MPSQQSNRSRDECIALRRQGHSLRLIAETLGVSQSTVRYHTRNLQRGEKTLQTRAYRRADAVTLNAISPCEDAAYLLGVIAGDGGLAATSRTCKLSIACDLRYPHLIEKYVALVERVVGKKTSVVLRAKGGKAPTWADVYVYHKDIAKFLDLPCGSKMLNLVTFPEWLWTEQAYARAFLRGLIETDGGVYRTYHNGGEYWYCLFTAKVAGVVDAFEKSVVYLGYEFKRSGPQFRLSKTAKVKALVAELELSKVRCYRYNAL